ncbi:hypothetical protein [Bradyrhizobium erythrophlei]|uniref:Uncharacterized protein n=1 Tax=Bradyrhizobium erythrophlei TaxID=1437360 RepID=A0A1M5NCL7_9BRAD|nr:hypothetical protein [Bradyrhizobium erythrophlei]SHG87314.1 hypothetical protein SAMN05443248_2939 [Bradyrhizobium erythrophlei]
MNKPLTAAEASAGHNRPAVLTADMLKRDFAYLDTAVAEIKKLYNACPPVCEDTEDLEIMRSAVKRFAGGYKRVEAVRVEAKEPYLDACRITDSHFNTLKSILEGWQTDVEGRAHRFLKKVEAEERARREEEARATAEAARVAAEAARLAEQERVEAEQTRLAETFVGDAPPTAGYDDRASAARIEETTLRTTAIQKSADAMKAQQAATAKPADLARTRTGTGLSTLTEVWKFEIINVDDVDLSDPVLRSCIPATDIAAAIGRYVRTHKGDRPLKGVRIYSDTKPLMT